MRTFPIPPLRGITIIFTGIAKTLPVKFIQYFGPGAIRGKGKWFGGFSPANSTFLAGMNMFQYFSMGKQKFLHIGLHSRPMAAYLAWAQKVIDANPGLPTIISTHAYLSNKGVPPERRNIWDELVRERTRRFS